MGKKKRKKMSENPFTPVAEDFVLKAHRLGFTVQEIQIDLHKKSLPVSDADIATLISIHSTTEPRFSRAWFPFGSHQMAKMVLPITCSQYLDNILGQGYNDVDIGQVRDMVVAAPPIAVFKVLQKFRDRGIDFSEEQVQTTTREWKQLEDVRCEQEDRWEDCTGRWILLANKVGFSIEEIVHELEDILQGISVRMIEEYVRLYGKGVEPRRARGWDRVAADFAVSSFRMGFAVPDITHQLVSQGYYFGVDGFYEAMVCIVRELRGNGHVLPGYR